MPTFTEEESSLSSWAGPYVTEMLGRGQALASMPYDAYMGPLTAGPSALQNQAFQGLGALGVPQANIAGSFTGAGYTPPTAQQAVDTSATGYTPFLAPQDGFINSLDGSAVRAMPQNNFTPATDNVMQQYMTPYLQGALQPQYDAAARQAQIAQQELQSQYGKAGAYGGSRQGVAEAELQRGLLDRMSGITGAGYQNAFEQAQNQFNKERTFGLQQLRQQAEGGREQRAIESEGIAADIAQFETERNDPKSNVLFMQSLLQGLPLETQTYTFNQPSGLQNLYGAINDGLNIYDQITPVRSQQNTLSPQTQASALKGQYDYYIAMGQNPTTAMASAQRDLSAQNVTP